MSRIDTNLLRASVRMVHCMQKERGSSCAFYADDSKLFELAMKDARMKTDIAAGLTHQKDLPRLLQKIRSFLEENKKMENSTDSTVLHRLFASFNTLISSVIHECILQPLGRHHRTVRKEVDREEFFFFPHESVDVLHLLVSFLPISHQIQTVIPDRQVQTTQQRLEC